MIFLETGVRRAGLLAVAATATGLIAGCGTGTPAASPTTTVVVTEPAATTPAAAASTPAVVASSAPAGPANCLPADLQASLGTGQGAAGTLYQDIVLTNTSASACTLYGYPGVSFVTGVGGSIIGAPATRNSVFPKTLVTLQPGGHAYTLIGVEQVGALSPTACQPTNASWLRIYPPGDYGALFVQYSAQVCSKPKQVFMTVSAVKAGTGS
jgi:hypothetical protein